MFISSKASEFDKFKYDLSTLYTSEFGTEYEVPFKKLELAEQKRVLKYESEFHPSSGVFCPLQHAYTRLIESTKPRFGMVSFNLDMILSVGTKMHEILQNNLSRTGRFIGNYRCTKCSRVHKLCTLPERCKKCGNRGIYAFKYEELGGMYKDTISWHTDGIWVDKKDQLWVIDFKSSSKYAVDAHKRMAKEGKKELPLPYSTNRVQIETYYYLLKKEHDLDIKGYGLQYIPRDTPGFGFEIVGKELNSNDHERIASRTEKVVKDFNRVANVLTEDRNGRTKTLEWAKLNKICDCRDTYDKIVHNKYKPCPLVDTCFKRDGLNKPIRDAARAVTLVEWLPKTRNRNED